MRLKVEKSYTKLHFTSIYTLVALLICLIFYLYYGKINSFLIINQFHHPVADIFFKYFTNLGDGLVWIFLLLATYFIAKKKIWIVVANFMISTIFAQGLKHLFFTEALRPIALMSGGYDLHFVEGVKIYTQHSFPSGHTTTAFAIAFTIILLLKKNNKFKYIGLFMAFMVAYSRVYLAQHYLIDVIAGGFLGISSTFASVYLLSLFRISKQAVIDAQSDDKTSLLAD